MLRIAGVAALNAAAPPTSRGVDVQAVRTAGVAAFAAFATNPLDVARTRVLVGSKPGGAAELLRTVDTVGREEGAAGLFAGAEYRVLYNGVVVAAALPLRALFYTGLRDFFILDETFSRAATVASKAVAVESLPGLLAMGGGG